MAALDALGLIDHADAVVIVCDGAHSAGLLAGTHQMRDRAVRTCLSAHTALFALIGVDLRPVLAYRNSAEFTGVETRLAHAQTAVVRYRICGKGALFAGRANDLHDVLGCRDSVGILRLRKADPLLDKFPLFIYAASVSSHRAGNDLIDQLFFVLFIKISVPGKPCCFFHDLVFEFHECGIICYHLVLLSANR